jgi:hypothetical protein
MRLFGLCCTQRPLLVQCTLKLDVNARDQPPKWVLGNSLRRPLYYVAFKSSLKGDCREVTLFLIQKGADPELMEGGVTLMEYGKGNFLDAVKEWRLMKISDMVQSSDRDFETNAVK